MNPFTFSLFRRLSVAAMFFAGASFLTAQEIELKNPGFEEGEVGRQPTGWLTPEVLKQEGWRVQTTEDSPMQANDAQSCPGMERVNRHRSEISSSH